MGCGRQTPSNQKRACRLPVANPSRRPREESPEGYGLRSTDPTIPTGLHHEHFSSPQPSMGGRSQDRWSKDVGKRSSRDARVRDKPCDPAGPVQHWTYCTRQPNGAGTQGNRAGMLRTPLKTQKQPSKRLKKASLAPSQHLISCTERVHGDGMLRNNHIACHAWGGMTGNWGHASIADDRHTEQRGRCPRGGLSSAKTYPA